jgi:hypothetical protein
MHVEIEVHPGQWPNIHIAAFPMRHVEISLDFLDQAQEAAMKRFRHGSTAGGRASGSAEFRRRLGMRCPLAESHGAVALAFHQSIMAIEKHIRRHLPRLRFEYRNELLEHGRVAEPEIRRVQ